MTRVVQHVWMQLVRRFGYAGVGGLSMLVVALALAAYLPRLKRQAVTATTSLATGEHDAVLRRTSQPRPVSETDLTREFVGRFPLMTQNAADLGAIFAAASHHHVALVKGEYQMKSEPNSPFVTFSATFPIRNDYASLREFSADVLTALPHVSMDELRLARDGASGVALDGVIRFTLIYRSS